MEFYGYVMSGDNAVARVEGSSYKVIDSRAPLALQRGVPLEQWLESRAIDRHRPHSRMLKKILRITDTADLKTVLYAHGATITDNYWVKSDNEHELTYSDITFNENIFADLALQGRASDFSKNYELASRTPELTNIGSYEKCWRIENGVWNMYKQGTVLERYSEVFVSRLAQALGFNAADYEISGEFIKTRDFTIGKYNFEPMAAVIGDEENYAINYNKLKELCSNTQNSNACNMPTEYINILFIATICFNVDLHTYNYGILRDRETGELVSMAPIFDNNMALIARGYSKYASLLTELFCNFLQEQNCNYQLPLLSREVVQDIAFSVMPELTHNEIDRLAAIELVMSGYTHIHQILSP